jgi:hypothetical protein
MPRNPFDHPALHGNSLDSLFLLKHCQSRRISSYAKDGSNQDWRDVAVGEDAVIGEIEGSGVVRHIWCTVASGDPMVLKRTILRAYWDDEPHASIEVPLGDFFGVGDGDARNIYSAPLLLAPQDGRAMVCYFPMPFASGARFTLENQGDHSLMFYYYIDYEVYPEAMDQFGRFHAQYRQARPAHGWPGVDKSMWEAKSPHAGTGRPDWWPENWDSGNTTGDHNYVLLEATGHGHYVGCNLSVTNLSEQPNDWYGEGDDMIFIDGEPWPPSLHGTGTEDYFNTAFCPKQEFATPYFGITKYSGDDVGRPYGGLNAMYRYHVLDPVRFMKSIKVTIEHGHDNLLTNDYSSVAYWYQREPHAPFAPLPSRDARAPRTPDAD